MTGIEQRALELKAASNVRRILQKLRLANSDNLEILQDELFMSLAENAIGLGDLHDKINGEADKGLEYARKRVAQQEEARAKEELRRAGPREGQAELDEMSDALNVKTQDITRSTGLMEGCEALDFDNVPEVKNVRDDAPAHAQGFPKAFDRVLAAQKEEDLARLREEVKSRLAEADAPVAAAEALCLEAEAEVEPIAKGRRGTSVEEMLVIGENSEALAAKAADAVDVAQQVVVPYVDDFLEEQRADAEAMAKEFSKTFRMRLGRMLLRIKRVQTCVARHRSAVEKARQLEAFDEMKAELLSRVAAALETDLIGPVEASIKEAERLVGRLRLSKSVGAVELQELLDDTHAGIEYARSSLENSRTSLKPIDQFLDEEVKLALSVAISTTEVKKVELKLGQFERRLTRITNLTAQYQKDRMKKFEDELAHSKFVVVQYLQKVASDLGVSHELFFDQIDAYGAGSINKEQFRQLIFDSDQSATKLSLLKEEIDRLFEFLLPKNAEAMTEDVFLSLLSGRMKVVKTSALTTDSSISAGKATRQLKIGEILRVLRLPVKVSGITRVNVQVEIDGAEGWATLLGNCGSAFLREIP